MNTSIVLELNRKQGGGNVNNTVVVMIVNSRPESIRIARAALSAFLKMCRLQEQEIWDVELGLNEAMANIIKHTYKSDSSKVIRIAFSWCDLTKEFLVTLRDYGDKVDPAIFHKVSLPSPEREGGFGLYLIRKIFDDVELVNLETGNLLKLRKSYL